MGLMLLASCFMARAAVAQEAHQAAPSAAVAEHPSQGEEHSAVAGHEEGAHEEAAHGENAAQGNAEGGHGGGHGGAHAPEIPDLLFVLKVPNRYRVPAYSIAVAVFLLLLFRWLSRNLQKVPGRGQSLIELYVELIDNFVCSILGREAGRRFVPFVGTLWVYIWCMNLFCLIPFGFSPTSMVQQTFALSIIVFVTVQWTALSYQGLMGYLFHLAGEPRDAIGWVLVPLFLPLHIMGELIKPVSLALRLYGNILGEDILLGVFSGLGIMLIQGIGWHDPWFGIPLHFPLIALVLLGSTIQATVFAVLTTIYISLVLPHYEEHEERTPAPAH